MVLWVYLKASWHTGKLTDTELVWVGGSTHSRDLRALVYRRTTGSIQNICKQTKGNVREEGAQKGEEGREEECLCLGLQDERANTSRSKMSWCMETSDKLLCSEFVLVPQKNKNCCFLSHILLDKCPLMFSLQGHCCVDCYFYLYICKENYFIALGYFVQLILIIIIFIYCF